MISIFRNKRGLGAPVGNLIILMAAVILSTTVVLFASNITANQVQKESLYISQTIMDKDNATIAIVNTGPTSIMINQIVIKGEKCAWNGTSTGITNNATTTENSTQTNGLAKGFEATIVVTIPTGLLTINDIGRPVTIVISTTQAAYFTETLVKATTGA